LRPDCFWPEHLSGLEAIAEFFGNVCMYLLSLIPESMLYFYHVLGQQDSQRAEYYADLLGSSVSGRQGFEMMFNKLEASYLAELAVQKASLGNVDKDYLSILRETYQAIPKREYERLRRVEEIHGLSIDASHPPTYLRRRVISKLGDESPKVLVDARRNELLDKEIEKYRKLLHEEAVDDHRRRLDMGTGYF